MIAAALPVLGGCMPHSAPPVIEQPAVVAPVAAPAAPVAANVARPVGPCQQVRDGNAMARLQGAGNDLVVRLANDPSFAGARYEHHPCYQLVLGFTDDRPRPEVVAEADAELRPFLAFATAAAPALSATGFGRAREEISAALGAARVKAVMFVSTYPQSIEIGVTSEADAQLVRSVIPVRYRPITKVVAGGYSEPTPERTSERDNER